MKDILLLLHFFSHCSVAVVFFFVFLKKNSETKHFEDEMYLALTFTYCFL